MRKQYAIASAIAIAASAVQAAPKVIHSLEASPAINGIISPGEWPENYQVQLSRAYHDQRAIRLYFAHDNNFLYLGADVQDQQLWADGNGQGSGEIFENAQDDSIEWYFDLNQSGEDFLQNDDRFLALNIGNFTDPVSGSGIVSRRSFNGGDGNGGAFGVLDPFTLDGINYKIQHRGTVNDSSDIDDGYSIEVAIPLSLLSGIDTRDGSSIAINTILISDDTGGTRDFTDNRDVLPQTQRFVLPILVDEYVELKHSELNGSQSGLNGPVSYTILQFNDPDEVEPPAAVTNFSVSNPRAFSVELSWQNPGDNGNSGHATGFDIRYSTSPITSANFHQADSWPFNSKANLEPGSIQSTRVMGLNPESNYFFAVRAFDEARNLGPITTTDVITTASIADMNTAIASQNYKGLIGIAPGGRYFIKENGEAIIPIGNHYLQQDDAIRHIYDGEVFTGSECHNFTENPEAEEKISAYMAKLKASGVTVMRLFLEDSSLFIPNNPVLNEENCAYWFENPRGNYNNTMINFMIEILRLSAENGIYVLINPFETFFYDEFFSQMTWHVNQGGPLTDINDFFNNSEVLAMSKDRWTVVINAIKNSGYEDAVFGYEIMNEWDSFEWTRPDNNPNTDAQIRIDFIRELATHVRSLDDEHLLISSTTALDPRGAQASFLYDSDTFDAVLPHLYLPGNREPWFNPESHIGTQVVREQANILSWWTSHQSNGKPVLNGEWGPSDAFHPTPDNPSYFSDFLEQDDELLIRKLYFTELASGAAGPGIRTQGGVRGGPEFGLHLSDNMFATAKTVSNFVNNADNSQLNFTNFQGDDLQGSFQLNNTSAPLFVTGTSDGHQGLIYIHQDANQSAATVNNAQIQLTELPGGGALQAEFWNTGINESSAANVVNAANPTLAAPNDSILTLPGFNDDWMIKFYEQYSTRLNTWREDSVQIINLEYKNMAQAGPVDVYVVYLINGQIFSLTRTDGPLRSVAGIAAYRTNITPADGLEELTRIKVNGTIDADVYIATMPAGSPVQNFNFKTLQFLNLNI